ncbi:MAG: hypothetical protein V4501_07425 [Pseudomonadota bacterium]
MSKENEAIEKIEEAIRLIQAEKDDKLRRSRDGFRHAIRLLNEALELLKD